MVKTGGGGWQVNISSKRKFEIQNKSIILTLTFLKWAKCYNYDDMAPPCGWSCYYHIVVIKNTLCKKVLLYKVLPVGSPTSFLWETIFQCLPTSDFSIMWGCFHYSHVSSLNIFLLRPFLLEQISRSDRTTRLDKRGKRGSNSQPSFFCHQKQERDKTR